MPAPDQSKQAGVAQLMLRLARTSEVRERTPLTPIVISRSRLDLSNSPCMTHRLLLCPLITSTGRYQPARSDPSWEWKLLVLKNIRDLSLNDGDTSTSLRTLRWTNPSEFHTPYFKGLSRGDERERGKRPPRTAHQIEDNKLGKKYTPH
ncbi:hypothetical protein J6590_024947 [Homalodisca vitripennis]|nr:hypothetical protein J6590_024947 [Homalodisca vitripennis]